MTELTLLNKIKIIEAEAEETEIHPDDLYFIKHHPTGEVHKRSFKKTLRDGELPPMSKSAKLELINHWNRIASGHTQPTYLYWL